MTLRKPVTITAGDGDAQPQRFLVGGETVVTTIEGLGKLANKVVKEAANS